MLSRGINAYGRRLTTLSNYSMGVERRGNWNSPHLVYLLQERAGLALLTGMMERKRNGKAESTALRKWE